MKIDSLNVFVFQPCECVRFSSMCNRGHPKFHKILNFPYKNVLVFMFFVFIFSGKSTFLPGRKAKGTSSATSVDL